MWMPRFVVIRSEKSLTSKENAASSIACSWSPLPIQPRWPVILPGCAADWHSDLSRQIFGKLAGAAKTSFSTVRAAASASPTVFAFGGLLALGSARRSCWCRMRMCRMNTDPASPAAAVFAFFAAGPLAGVSGFRFLPSKETQIAPTELAAWSASRHHRRAEAFGCLAMPLADETRTADGREAVGPVNKANLQGLPVDGTVHEALSGSICKIFDGYLRSRQPRARLVGMPVCSSASCLGRASTVHGLLNVSTASSHIALASSYSFLATASNFSNLFICHLICFSASSATLAVSHIGVLSTPNNSAAPSRVWMFVLNTLNSSLQPAASVLIIVSASSFAASSRAKALL
mmetsp:Transcript_30872/g.66440  ORF Transcript_30872/g.66440 Transcript_30872/m.66440 type:complete len:347 (-) Transcript_30872:589-1629(-)